jgi:uncharacterized membrane protein YdjX (TVP38/TMEM64 family)
VAAILAILAISVAAIVASANLWERLRNPELGLLGYLSLFITCWIGAGGALVPIPGVRAVSWVMIVQQGAAFDPLVVTGVAATAMVLGQTSYFFATRAAVARATRGHATGTIDAELHADDEPPEPDVSRRQRMTALMQRAREAVERQIGRHGFLTVFFVCALPTPLTTLTTTAAADSGMSYPRYLIAAAGGFVLLCGVLAFLGDTLFGGIFPLFR